MRKFRLSYALSALSLVVGGVWLLACNGGQGNGGQGNGGQEPGARQPDNTPEASFPAQDPATPEAVAAHRQEVEAFRRDRDQSLRQSDSWLTLVNLAWLQEGTNTIGSAPTADVVLPPAIHLQFGKLMVPGPNGSAAELQASPGQHFVVAGQQVERQALLSDAQQGGPTKVEVGTVSFYVIRRGDKLGVRVKDSAAETLTHFQGVESFAPDFSWRVRGRWEPHTPPRKLAIPNVLGQVSESDSPGAFVFTRNGQTWRLEAVEGEGEQGIHFIFADGTSGKATYGAGRFLDGHVEQASRNLAGTAIVDFNLAYNPPCVFTPYATCPLPPIENKIALPIEAGEKNWGQH